MLAADPDSQRQRMGELSRKVTILRVNEKTLSRRYTLLHEAEAAHRKVGSLVPSPRVGEGVWPGMGTRLEGRYSSVE